MNETNRAGLRRFFKLGVSAVLREDEVLLADDPPAGVGQYTIEIPVEILAAAEQIGYEKTIIRDNVCTRLFFSGWSSCAHWAWKEITPMPCSTGILSKPV